MKGYRHRRLRRSAGPRWWVRVNSPMLTKEQAHEIKQSFNRARGVVVTSSEYTVERLR